MTTRLDQHPTYDLRRRAAHLRDLDRRVHGCLIMQLHRWAGEDTWQMPRADLCRQLLQTNQRQLRRCCETLLAAAQHLEQQAELIESSVLAGVGRTP